jgi:hypothetical protein
MTRAIQPYWEMPTGPERERAKSIKELRQGRWACRHWMWKDENIRYYIGPNGENFEFLISDGVAARRAAQQAARQSFDRILETL